VIRFSADAIQSAGGRAMIRPAIVYLCVASVFTLLSPRVGAEELRGYWPQWRGPNRDNLSSDTGLRAEWPGDGPPLQWSVKGIGDGIAAIAVSGGRVITLGDIDGEEFVTTLDERTGQSLWTATIGPALGLGGVMPLMRWLSQRTPTIDGDRLYAITADGQLVCLDFDNGTERWRKDYRTEFASGSRVWGFCDYPLVDGTALICLPLGSKAGIVALNKFSGEVIWRQTFEQKRHPAYGAIISTKVAGTKQYVAALEAGIAGFSTTDGSRLWWYENPIGRGPITQTLIVLDDESIFSSLGYRSGGVTRIEPHREGGLWKVRERYAQRVPIDVFQDGAVAVKNHVYTGAFRAGMLICIDWRTGETVWSHTSSEASGGRRRRSSNRIGLTYADEHLFCLHANGTVRLVKAAPTGYVEKASFSIPDYQPARGATLPVVTAGRLYIRDNDRLLCFDVRKESGNTVPGAPSRVVLSKPERRSSNDERPVPKPIFVSTPEAVVDMMLEVAEVKKESVVIDLGSGDGRIVITAAKKYGCHAVGYEIDPDLVRESCDNVRAERMSELVTIRDQDMFTADLSGVDVVTVYLNPNVLEKMKLQFGQMKPGSRIVSHLFEIPGVEPHKRLVAESESGEGHEILLYVTPLKYAENASQRN
jgi:outer membrane protein assembly factor BamB